ncbi:hypothetical protein [Leifsonia sp. 2MCAF36]|uniref:hypothetical protein n=1 Tax=Leifsonia sp. 2MCAF36 TaxID=3232988 RepID=UPI003F9552A1
MDGTGADENRRGHDGDKSTIGERLTGTRDPKDPDGLLTVEDDAERPDPVRFGSPETDTLQREREHFAQLGEGGSSDELPEVPAKRGVTGLG